MSESTVWNKQAVFFLQAVEIVDVVSLVQALVGV